MQHRAQPGRRTRAFSGLVAATILVASQLSAAGSAGARPARASPYRPGAPASASSFYQSVWGVDNFLVRATASGSLIRFSYRVVDPVRAEALGDGRATPRLVDPARGVELRVPNLEKVGELRQKGKPVAGMEYWMVFSNKGLPVRTGDRVNVVIGDFHADGLVVE